MGLKECNTNDSLLTDFPLFLWPLHHGIVPCNWGPLHEIFLIQDTHPISHLSLEAWKLPFGFSFDHINDLLVRRNIDVHHLLMQLVIDRNLALGLLKGEDPMSVSEKKCLLVQQCLLCRSMNVLHSMVHDVAIHNACIGAAH